MKKKIGSAIFAITAIAGMVLIDYRSARPITPLDVITTIIGSIFIICFVTWHYYDDLKNKTPRQQYWDFMSYLGMVISGIFLATISAATI